MQAGLLLGIYGKQGLIFAAKVKNGFIPRIRDEIFPSLKTFQTAQCPFRNLPGLERIVNRRENVGMPLGQSEAGLSDRSRRMDGRRAFEALHLRRHPEGQEAWGGCA